MVISRPYRRRGKEWRERAAAVLVLLPASPVLGACALAIKAEGVVDPTARGPVFVREDRISRGRVIRLIKFRCIRTRALATLEGKMILADLEQEGAGDLTRVGRVIRQWYLDELPQLWNIVKGDMFVIGTRPYPIRLYEDEMAEGITRKRDMPAGLVGPVQSLKGRPQDPVAVDAEYWDAYRTLSPLRLLLLDLKILWRSLRVQLEHRGL